MKNFYSDKLRNLTPYTPGEQPKDGKYIKLNTNENPYPPSPKVVQAIVEATAGLRLYPDPECTDLKNVYAEYLNVKPENIFAGNGSDEVLAIAFQAFFAGKKDVIMPDITYSFYPVYCNLYDVDSIQVPVKEDFSIDYNMYIRPNNGIVIANPNAPTSVALGIDEIELIVKSNPNCVVLIDEAYVDFGAESAVCLVNKYENLLVVSTFSKSRSLAGLRIGFAAGNENLIKAMETVKDSINSYPVDILAQEGAKAAILDMKYFEQMRAKVIKTRDITKKNLESSGFTVLPSKANFLFIKHKTKPADYIFQELKKEKILVRYFNKPRIDNYLRVSIGTDEQMETFFKIIKEIGEK